MQIYRKRWFGDNDNMALGIFFSLLVSYNILSCELERCRVYYYGYFFYHYNILVSLSLRKTSMRVLLCTRLKALYNM